MIRGVGDRCKHLVSSRSYAGLVLGLIVSEKTTRSQRHARANKGKRKRGTEEGTPHGEEGNLPTLLPTGMRRTCREKIQQCLRAARRRQQAKGLTTDLLAKRARYIRDNWPAIVAAHELAFGKVHLADRRPDNVRSALRLLDLACGILEDGPAFAKAWCHARRQKAVGIPVADGGWGRGTTAERLFDASTLARALTRTPEAEEIAEETDKVIARLTQPHREPEGNAIREFADYVTSRLRPSKHEATAPTHTDHAVLGLSRRSGGQLRAAFDRRSTMNEHRWSVASYPDGIAGACNAARQYAASRPQATTIRAFGRTFMVANIHCVGGNRRWAYLQLETERDARTGRATGIVGRWACCARPHGSSLARRIADFLVARALRKRAGREAQQAAFDLAGNTPRAAFPVLTPGAAPRGTMPAMRSSDLIARMRARQGMAPRSTGPGRLPCCVGQQVTPYFIGRLPERSPGDRRLALLDEKERRAMRNLQAPLDERCTGSYVPLLRPLTGAQWFRATFNPLADARHCADSLRCDGYRTSAEVQVVADKSGKLRAVTKHDARLVSVARCMTRALLASLHRFVPSRDMLEAEPVHIRWRGAQAVVGYSADLSAATDHIGSALATAGLHAALMAIDAPQWMVEAIPAVTELISLRVGNSLRPITCGALMGLGPGWVTLSLLNSFAASRAGAQIESFRVCGDDLVGVWPVSICDRYEAQIRRLGLVPNVSKSYRGNAAVFCEQFGAVRAVADGHKLHMRPSIRLAEASGAESRTRGLGEGIGQVDSLFDISQGSVSVRASPPIRRLALHTAMRLSHRGRGLVTGRIRDGGCGHGPTTMRTLRSFIMCGSSPVARPRVADPVDNSAQRIRDAVSDALKGAQFRGPGVFLPGSTRTELRAEASAIANTAEVASFHRDVPDAQTSFLLQEQRRRARLVSRPISLHDLLCSPDARLTWHAAARARAFRRARRGSFRDAISALRSGERIIIATEMRLDAPLFLGGISTPTGMEGRRTLLGAGA